MTVETRKQLYGTLTVSHGRALVEIQVSVVSKAKIVTFSVVDMLGQRILRF